MSSSAKRLEDRLEVRLTPKQKSLLKRAAATQRMTVSAFVLESGLTAAAEALAERQAVRCLCRRTGFAGAGKRARGSASQGCSHPHGQRVETKLKPAFELS